jgi:hypothetical protein
LEEVGVNMILVIFEGKLADKPVTEKAFPVEFGE